MRLIIFSKFSPLKLLSMAGFRFDFVIVMLKRLKLIIIVNCLKIVDNEMWDSMIERVKCEYTRKKNVNCLNNNLYVDTF